VHNASGVTISLQLVPAEEVFPLLIEPEKLSIDHGHLDQKSQVWTILIRNGKTRFTPWSCEPEKPCLGHGYSDQISKARTMVI
jgi:hypothetical protein